MNLNALLAREMPTRHKYSVLISKIAYITQPLLIKLLLHGLLSLLPLLLCLPSLPTLLAPQRVLPDLVALAEHLNLIQHLGKAV